MKTKELEFEIPGLAADDHLKFNHNHTGFYHTKYLQSKDKMELN